MLCGHRAVIARKYYGAISHATGVQKLPLTARVGRLPAAEADREVRSHTQPQNAAGSVDGAGAATRSRRCGMVNRTVGRRVPVFSCRKQGLHDRWRGVPVVRGALVGLQSNVAAVQREYANIAM